MHYASVENLSKSYGVRPLFNNITFHLNEGDKIALVARNGSGKSTLLKILAGKETADAGTVWIHKDVTVALFEQEPVFLEDRSVLDNIFYHEHPVLNAIKAYEDASDAGDGVRITEAIVRLDELNAWDFDAKVRQILGKLNIHNLQQLAVNLSGGQRKRVALARTLIDIGFEHRHVLLIMDEPTNHLDVGMVEWLENYLDQQKVTLLLVTHDRYFLDAVSTGIWEMDGSALYTYAGDYENYLEKKTARIDSELASIDKARNTYRKELEWMRKQPKARTTKSRSREERFYSVEAKAKQRIDDQQVELQMKMSRLGGKVAELKKVYKKFGELTILKGFDYTFKKGERVGVIGSNGVGKTTFLNILQELELPDSGKVNIGETVIFGNYSQQGLPIKEDMRVIEYVKNIAENFPLASGGSLSAAQFLNLFLFPPEQQYTYVSKLSGGEKRRLHLLTILFRNPNFLVLDEPTNDLDLPTLAVLENFLSEYQGCLLIVSHDRYFMDRLVDHLLVLEGGGQIRDFPGNYSQYRDWLKENPASAAEALAKATPNAEALANPALGPQPSSNPSSPEALAKVPPGPEPSPNPAPSSNPTSPVKPKRRMSYKEKREFEILDREIRELAREKQEITDQLAIGTTRFDELQRLSVRVGEIAQLLDDKELRWLELSEFERG